MKNSSSNWSEADNRIINPESAENFFVLYNHGFSRVISIGDNHSGEFFQWWSKASKLDVTLKYFQLLRSVWFEWIARSLFWKDILVDISGLRLQRIPWSFQTHHLPGSHKISFLVCDMQSSDIHFPAWRTTDQWTCRYCRSQQRTIFFQIFVVLSQLFWSLYLKNRTLICLRSVRSVPCSYRSMQPWKRQKIVDCTRRNDNLPV